MNYGKVTSHIVFTVFTAIIVAGMVTSCSSEEYEGPKKTFAVRRNIKSGDPSGMDFGNINAYIPDELIGTSGCVYNAIHNAFGERYTLDSIKNAMRFYSNDIEYYPIDSITYAINKLTGKSVTSYSPSNTSHIITSGDIVCFTPNRIKELTGKEVSTGHAAVVVSFSRRDDGFINTNCHDGSFFSLVCVSLIIRTSELSK